MVEMATFLIGAIRVSVEGAEVAADAGRDAFATAAFVLACFKVEASIVN